VKSHSYGDDLARIHHEGHSSAIVRSAPHLLRLLRRHGIARGRVVDLGCGSGEWCRALGAAGYDAIGVDASASMIAIARRVAPRAHFDCAPVQAIEIEPCAAITALGEVLSYLPPRVSVAALFRRIACALEPGGLFVFDVLVRGTPPMNYCRARTASSWAVLVDVAENSWRGVLRRDITTFVRVRGSYRRGFETHVLRVYEARALVRALEHAGFRVSTARSYGRVRLADRRLAFVARKPLERASR
jgi:SAM-dependent methyltransferase